MQCHAREKCTNIYLSAMEILSVPDRNCYPAVSNLHSCYTALAIIVQPFTIYIWYFKYTTFALKFMKCQKANIKIYFSGFSQSLTYVYLAFPKKKVSHVSLTWNETSQRQYSIKSSWTWDSFKRFLKVEKIFNLPVCILTHPKNGMLSQNWFFFHQNDTT